MSADPLIALRAQYLAEGYPPDIAEALAAGRLKVKAATQDALSDTRAGMCVAHAYELYMRRLGLGGELKHGRGGES